MARDDQVTNQLFTGTRHSFSLEHQQGITFQQRQPISVNAVKQGQNQLAAKLAAIDRINANDPVTSLYAAAALVRTFYYL